jgi:formylmethanofuran dehydrogenase subunit E
LFIALLAWWFVRGVIKSRHSSKKEAAQPVAENMVACARCGVNMPASEARMEAGKYFCLDNPKCLP